MNKSIFSYLAMLVTLSLISHQASAWSWKATNWAPGPDGDVYVWGDYMVCSLDHPQLLKPQETKSFDAKGCLMTKVLGRPAASTAPGLWVPYTSSGQRTYDHFYIIKIGGQYFSGRLE